MKIEIIKIGKCRHKGLDDLAEEYVKRLKPFVGIDWVIWKETDLESKLKKLIQSDSIAVALDERGKQWSSIELSKKLSTWSNNPSVKKVSFVIGGPYGLPIEFRKNADQLWSLSSCTLPSDFAWLTVCEQIYRGFTILKGMSYHHE